jgi:hypothetical protein
MQCNNLCEACGRGLQLPSGRVVGVELSVWLVMRWKGWTRCVRRAPPRAELPCRRPRPTCARGRSFPPLRIVILLLSLWTNSRPAADGCAHRPIPWFATRKSQLRIGRYLDWPDKILICLNWKPADRENHIFFKKKKKKKDCGCEPCELQGELGDWDLRHARSSSRCRGPVTTPKTQRTNESFLQVAIAVHDWIATAYYQLITCWGVPLPLPAITYDDLLTVLNQGMIGATTCTFSTWRSTRVHQASDAMSRLSFQSCTAIATRCT